MRFFIKKIIAASFLMGGVFLMLSLGMWQLDRLSWKKEIIHELDRVYNSSNLPLYSYDNLKDAAQSDQTFRYGHIKGKALWSKQIFYGPKAKDRVMGFHVITPIEIKPNHHILVNRGWISEEKKQNYKAPKQHNVQFTGLIRKPDWNKFTPDNSPENEIWTKLDTQQIAETRALSNTLPLILYAHKSSLNDEAIKLLEDKWYPRNKHAQYAAFWFSMAVLFLGFFGFYAYRAQRNKEKN